MLSFIEEEKRERSKEWFWERIDAWETNSGQKYDRYEIPSLSFICLSQEKDMALCRKNIPKIEQEVVSCKVNTENLHLYLSFTDNINNKSTWRSNRGKDNNNSILWVTEEGCKQIENIQNLVLPVVCCGSISCHGLKRNMKTKREDERKRAESPVIHARIICQIFQQLSINSRGSSDCKILSREAKKEKK